MNKKSAADIAGDIYLTTSRAPVVGVPDIRRVYDPPMVEPPADRVEVPDEPNFWTSRRGTSDREQAALGSELSTRLFAVVDEFKTRGIDRKTFLGAFVLVLKMAYADLAASLRLDQS